MNGSRQPGYGYTYYYYDDHQIRSGKATEIIKKNCFLSERRNYVTGQVQVKNTISFWLHLMIHITMMCWTSGKWIKQVNPKENFLCLQWKHSSNKKYELRDPFVTSGVGRGWQYSRNLYCLPSFVVAHFSVVIMLSFMEDYLPGKTNH